MTGKESFIGEIFAKVKNNIENLLYSVGTETKLIELFISGFSR